VQIGSGCIYNGYDKEYSEEDEPNFGLYSDDSSFYSKCKHASEILLDNTCVYILRIRIPFTFKNVSKNYLTKLLKYDNLIDESNSVTSVTDLNNFIFRFLHVLKEIPGGIYNVVNPTPVKASDVVQILKNNGIENKNWNFIETSQLNTKAKRSNCVLSTKKIEKFNLSMPNSLESIERDVKIFKNFI
jgi:dTDP-4-dehydrorhamnose reductase